MTRGLDDLQIGAVAAANQRLQSRLGALGAPNVREAWLRGSISDLHAKVRKFAPDDYALPAHFQKITAPDDYATLCRILGEVRVLNDECAGLGLGESELLLGTDPRPGEIRRSLMSVYDRLVPRRLARPNSRDVGNPVRRFQRLLDELLPGIDDILDLGPSVHPRCLSTPQDYAAWLLYRATWKPLVAFTRRAGGIEVQFRGSPEWRRYCLDMLSLYRWHQEDDLQYVLRRVRAHAPALGPGGPDEARLRLKAMAEDFEVMRPLLVRNYRASRSMVSLTPGLCVAWQWNIGEVVGNVIVAPDERSLLAAEHDLKHHEILSVDREGLLALQDLRWVRSLDLDPPADALAANLYILGRLHERVFEMYERVDTAAILAGFRPPAAGDGSDDAGVRTDEVLAIAAQRSQEGEPADETSISVSGVNAGARRRVRGMRFERFVRLLTALGCEVRQGKGSEVNVYRVGGRIARIGHHLRNPELTPVHLRIVLDRLDIPVAEFLARI